MASLRPLSCLLPLALTAPLLAAGAQRPTVRVGLGGGVAGAPVTGRAHRGSSPHALATLGLAPRRGIAELRLDALWLMGNSDVGPVSMGANALAPLGSVGVGSVGRLRPYVVAGAGVYGVGGVGPRVGAAGGAGTRLERPRLALFAEARHHTAHRSTFGTLGLTFSR
ncbi:hypothetical protein [Roseisolibacter agri]|uniref:hypothetical protein n=1 Tax=Roseisolibacter agri TaxID=2014610 RepID=UPI0024E05D97|nr:hypothetical protein [Roseisolibacter agri]